MHALVLRRSQPDESGRYRTVPVAISGSPLVPLDPVAVPAAIDDLFLQWNHMAAHPIVIGAEMHAALMKIHPFVDGNGRTGRLLLNLWLMSHRYPPSLWDPARRAHYYTALQAADVANAEPIIAVVIEGIAQTLRIYEEVLRITPES